MPYILYRLASVAKALRGLNRILHLFIAHTHGYGHRHSMYQPTCLALFPGLRGQMVMPTGYFSIWFILDDVSLTCPTWALQK